MGKKVWIFLDLSVRENPDKTQLTSSSFVDPLWFASLCWWPLFSLFSGALCISFSCCSSLDICLFTYVFSCSLSRPSRHILPILASFLTFLRVFVDSLYAFYFLLSLVALSLSFRPIFTQSPFFTNLNYNNLTVDKTIALPVLLLCELIKNCKLLRITVQLQPHQFDCHSQRVLQIICLRGFTSTSSREALV